MKRGIQDTHCSVHRGLHAYMLSTSGVCAEVFTILHIFSWTKAFTLKCLQAKGRANATKGCFYEWGSCAFILLKRFMHLGAVLHFLNGAFLLWYDFILSLVQEQCIKHFFFCYMNKALVFLCCVGFAMLSVSQSVNAQQTSSSFYKITFWAKDMQERTFPICLDCSRHVLFLPPCRILGCKKSKSNQKSHIVYMCHMCFSR